MSAEGEADAQRRRFLKFLRRKRRLNLADALAEWVPREIPTYGALGGSSFEADHFERYTANQIAATPTLKLLSEQMEGRLLEAVPSLKEQYAARGASRSALIALLYIVTLLGSMLFAPNYGIFESTWLKFFTFGWIGVFYLVFVAMVLRAYWKPKWPVGLMVVVPAVYAILQADTAEFAVGRKPPRLLIRYLERVAKSLESIANFMWLSHKSARGPVAALAYKKAAYVRGLKLYVLLPTGLSKNDLLHELSELIRVTLTDGWQNLPEADPELDKTTSRMQRFGYRAGAVIAFAAVVMSGLWGHYLGAGAYFASAILTAVFLYCLSKVDIAASMVQNYLSVSTSLRGP